MAGFFTRSVCRLERPGSELEDKVGVVETFMSFGRIVPAMLAELMRRGRAQWAAMRCGGARAGLRCAAGRSVKPVGFARCGGRSGGATTTEGAAPLYDGGKSIAEATGNVLRWLCGARADGDVGV